MKVLELYIMRRAFAIFAMTLLWVLAIVWTTQVLARIDVVTSTGQSAATFFEIAALVLPAVIPVVLPFALGIAVAHTLTSMNTDSELVVIAAAGSSRTTVIRPILIIALIVSAASFAIENGIEPYARERLRTVVSQSRADLITSVVQEGSFQTIEDGLVLQISERLPDGRFGGVFLADTRDETTELIYYADTGATVEINGEHILVMQDGVVHRRSPQGDVSVIRYRSYAFDLAEFAPATDGPSLLPKDRTIGYLLNPDPDDFNYQRSPGSFRAELHRRFSDWLYPLVFALVALAVAGDARSFRESRLHPVLTTMMIALFVRWEGFFVANEAAASSFFLYAMYGVPIGAIIVCLFFIFTNRSLEIPTAWAERLQTLGAAALRRWNALVSRGRPAGEENR